MKTHAERELEILTAITPDAIILEFKNEIISLCKAFSESDQSGGSVPYTARAISMAVEELMMHKTIAPLTGEDSEWNDVSEANGGFLLFQNNRDGRVFKDSKDGKARFIDAIVWNGDKSGTFTGWVEGINSSQIIKSFPFKPKTFYVDVIDFRWKDKEEKILDDNGDWWTHRIKNESQLKEALEYYDKSYIPRAK